MKLYCFKTEIPGPTRKVPPAKISGSETNEISSKTNKNQQISGKESHLPSVKDTYKNQDYDENYTSNEEDFESPLGSQEIG